MSEVWQRLWKTPQGKEYEVLKSDLDHRKERVNAQARQLEDGIYKKVIAGGRLIAYIKTSVIVSSEEAVAQATAEVDRIRGELEQAKTKLKQLQKGKEDQIERVNVLVVEELGGNTPQSKSRRLPLGWGVRQASYEAIAQAIIDTAAVEELMDEPLTEIDATLAGLVEVLDGMAGSVATEDDLSALVEPEGVPSAV